MSQQLLCPAGSMESLETALHFGADAVYGGMKRFGLRAFAGNFDEPNLRLAVSKAHALGKKFYLTMNVFPFDDQLDAFVDAGRLAQADGVDAVIVSDLGAIVTLREKVPGLPIHVSTQASTVNAAACGHYRSLGCSRVILAREVSIDRMRALHEQLGDSIELETFVHGAACMAWSGRCLLSAYLAGRSGNQGACAQSCRWEYAVVEKKRPGEYLPVCEDENGTYIFSANDLNLMEHLPALKQAGIASLKIEGRMKTEYYVATITAAYRRALNALENGSFEAMLPALQQELTCASHRRSDDGFAVGHPQQPGGAQGFHQSREFIARVADGCEAGGEARLLLKNRFHAGDALELLTPDGVFSFTAGSMLREKTGERVDTLGIGGEYVRLEMPVKAAAGDIVRGPVRNHRE